MLFQHGGILRPILILIPFVGLFDAFFTPFQKVFKAANDFGGAQPNSDRLKFVNPARSSLDLIGVPHT